MLVLTRSEGEIIMLQTKDGQVMAIRVLHIAGKEVKIGIAADSSVKIVRGELLEDQFANVILEKRDGRYVVKSENNPSS